MNWLFFALLAPALYALVIFVDKYILSRYIKNYLCMPLYASIVGLLSGITIWFLSGMPILPIQVAIFALTAGILTVISFVMYYKAIFNEDASNVNLFFQIGPIFVFVLAFLFLGEKLNIKQFFGFILIFFAVYSASLSTNQKRTRFYLSKPLVYMLIYDILWAISVMFMKFALNTNSFSVIISYQNLGVALGGMGIYFFVPSIRKSFMQSIKNIKKRVIGILIFNEFLFVFARALTYIAYSLGSVAIVSVLEGTMIFYGIFYGWLLTTLIPKNFNEDISKKTLTKKILLAGILFIGVFLVN